MVLVVALGGLDSPENKVPKKGYGTRLCSSILLLISDAREASLSEEAQARLDESCGECFLKLRPASMRSAANVS
jgi:hypothetical protein